MLFQISLPRRSQRLLRFLVQALEQRGVKFRHLDRYQVSAAGDLNNRPVRSGRLQRLYVKPVYRVI